MVLFSFNPAHHAGRVPEDTFNINNTPQSRDILNFCQCKAARISENSNVLILILSLPMSNGTHNVFMMTGRFIKMRENVRFVDSIRATHPNCGNGAAMKL
jgi:hypothetical protein